MKKRANKVYEKKVWVTMPDGTRKRKSVYNKDERIVKVKANEIENKVNKGTYVTDNGSTFEEIAEKWFNAKAKLKAVTTQESYLNYKNHAVRLIGKRKIQDIKPMDLDEAYAKFMSEKSRTKNSLKHLHNVVNMVLKFAKKNTLIYSNPCDEIEKEDMRPAKFTSYVYNEVEFNNLLKFTRGTQTEVIVILAGGVGLRAGEICGLKWENIDFKENTIKITEARYRTTGNIGVKKPKSDNSIRTIPVDQNVIDVLNRHKNKSEYVLCRKTGNPFMNCDLYHMLVKAIEGNGLHHTRLHDLRHYNATMMAKYGVDIKTAAARLGDDVMTVLKIYQHVQNSMNKSAADKLSSMYTAFN